MPLGYTIPRTKIYVHQGSVVNTYTDDFSPAAGVLAPPWVQGAGTSGHNLRYSGAGTVRGTAVNTDSTATYNNTIRNDQYSQITPQFSGPGDGTSYVYLFVRASNILDWFTAGSGQAGYWFRSDGGSDTSIVYFSNGTTTPTTLITDNAFTYLGGEILRFQIVGTTLKVFKNGIEDTALRVSDSNIISGYPGIGLKVSTSGNDMDDFLAGDFPSTDQTDWKRKYDNSVIAANYTPDIINIS